MISCAISSTIGSWTLSDAKKVMGSVLPRGPVVSDGFVAAGLLGSGLPGIEAGCVAVLEECAPGALAAGELCCPLNDCVRNRFAAGSSDGALSRAFVADVGV